MQHWKKILHQSITGPEGLPPLPRADISGMEEVVSSYPMRINPYYLGLITRPGDPIWRQAVPDPRELADQTCYEDPLGEEDLSPVPNLIHKYPDRALFLVSSECAMYCRFCTRKRKVGTGRMQISDETIRAGLEYLKKTPEIRDVLVSGGDPLLLDDDRLEWILKALRRIPSVAIIRIGTRVPCTLPMRVTVKLARLLKKYHPLYINTHFNHPAELTPQAAVACKRLADAGIPLGCQTVLLRDINNDAQTVKKLLYGLLLMRVKPYYIFQGDMTKGTDHFRTTLAESLSLMKALIGNVSGMAVPTLAVDIPGGYGKVPLTPGYLLQEDEGMVFENYQGRLCTYTDPILA